MPQFPVYFLYNKYILDVCDKSWGYVESGEYHNNNEEFGGALH